jgi:hypothetical protein
MPCARTPLNAMHASENADPGAISPLHVLPPLLQVPP